MINRLLQVAAFCLALPVLASTSAWAQTQAGADTTPRSQAPQRQATGITYDIRPALTAARQAMAQGDFARAERLYKILVQHVPHMTEVRMEYAAAAYRAGQDQRAKEILVPVDVDALPPGLRSTYRNIVWGERAFDISFSPRVMFDSNINSGPSSDTVTIGGVNFSVAEENLPANSFGLGGTLAAQGLWMPTRKMGLGATVIADGDFYEDSDFNDIRLSLTAGPRFIVGPTLLRLNGLAGTRYLGGDQLENNVGGQAAITFNVAPGTPLTFSGSRREYDGESRSGLLRDRSLSTLAASISSANVLPWEGLAWVNTAVERENWTRNLEDNNAYRGGFGVSLPKNHYVDTHLMFNATHRKYDNIIPLLAKARSEWRFEPSVRVEFKALETPVGSPYVQYTYIDNQSNVALTDYVSHKVTGGLTIKAW